MRGLNAIKANTKVNLKNVRDAINQGKVAKKERQTIIQEIGDIYERNAVISYLNQHPLN